MCGLRLNVCAYNSTLFRSDCCEATAGAVFLRCVWLRLMLMSIACMCSGLHGSFNCQSDAPFNGDSCLGLTALQLQLMLLCALVCMQSCASGRCQRACQEQGGLVALRIAVCRSGSGRMRSSVCVWRQATAQQVCSRFCCGCCGACPFVWSARSRLMRRIVSRWRMSRFFRPCRGVHLWQSQQAGSCRRRSLLTCEQHIGVPQSSGSVLLRGHPYVIMTVCSTAQLCL
jgi:hypothetical protein